MSSELRNELLSLHGCVTGGDPHAARERIRNLMHCFYEISSKSTDYGFSLLFDKEFGIISFLRNTLDKDEFQDSQSDILELLVSLVGKHTKSLVHYAVDIKVICVSLFTRGKSSKVKNNVIPLLIELLRLPLSPDVCRELEIKSMIEKFMMELTKPASKHSATVKGNLYHILGVFAELYPELMVSYSNRILETFVSNLKTEMTSKTKKPELSIIAGCLQGLTSLLLNFTHFAEEGGQFSYDIYKYVRMALDVNIKHTRYDVPRAALQLLTKHACQFSRFLMDEYEKMYDILRFWSGHHNHDLLHCGTYAFESFLKQISLTLLTRAKDGSKDVDTFKFFIKKFREMMNDHTASSKSISLAIRGYGLLSGPCRVFLSADDVHFMYTEMMQRSEQIYFGQMKKNVDDQLMNLPSFLEAFSCIVMELDQVSETFLLSLERLVVLMIENYPRLHKKVHFICFMAIFRIYFAVSRKGAASQAFLSKTIYQGLIRTCSHPIVVQEAAAEKQPLSTDANADEENLQTKISYKDYLDFWKTLLDVATMKELSQLGLSLEERDLLAVDIYNDLITAILMVFSRLDLTSTKSGLHDSLQSGTEALSSSVSDDDEVTYSSDPLHGLQANRPSDFVIFVNLVDFCRDILTVKKMELFGHWMYKFGYEVIVYSSRNPLVSGFYKLVTVCFQICTKISYFKDLSAPVIKESKESMEVDLKEIVALSDGINGKRICLDLFTKFVKEVSVQTRCYRDDLLSSSLIMILVVPDEILTGHLDIVASAIQRALLVGRSYLPLAKIALSTLEHWCCTFPSNLMEPYYKEILPLLDPYMKSMEDTATDATLGSHVKSSGKRTGKKLLKTKLNQTNIHDTELAVVRHQCVRLLGHLGGSINNVLVNRSNPLSSQTAAVAWDVQKHLKFDVPFVDLKPTVYFDQFLPRVVELATTSSDRRTKVAACELLHSLVLLMVGRGGTQMVVSERPDDLKKHSMAPLYRKIFPAIMQLACDVEQVSRQLFDPLMNQLIHWFTGYKISQSEETLTLLNSIMDGLVNSEDSALRDFSAICLREFLKWSIKQATKEEFEKSPGSVKAMLKHFHSLARHPNAFKRLGAALGFNNIYTIFREEESLVDMFVLELLVTFIESLALAHSDDKALGTQLQCHLVIKHLERIINEKAKLLIKTTKIRRKPKNWKEGNLTCLLDWLLDQCGRPQTECRHSAMELIFSLSPSSQVFKTPKDFFEYHLKQNGPGYFIEKFEKESYKLSIDKKSDKCGLSPLRRNAVTDFSLKVTLSWFEIVLASLDCYTWVFGQDILDPRHLFCGNHGSVLFEVLKNFIEDFAFFDLDTASKGSTTMYTPKEKEAFNQAKCTLIVRMLDFLCILFRRYGQNAEQIVPVGFMTSDIWRLVIICIVEPTSIGFNMADVEVMTKLPEQTSAVATSLRHAPKVASTFQRILLDYLQSQNFLDLQNTSQLSVLFSGEKTMNQSSLSHLLRSYMSLYAAGYLADLDSAKVSLELIQHVYEGIVLKTEKLELVAKHLSPTELDLFVDYLNLGFSLKPELSQVIDLLLDRTLVLATMSSSSNSSTYRGDLFYVTFKSAINNFLLTVLERAVPRIVSFAEAEPGLVGSMLINLLDIMSQSTSHRHKHGSQLVDALLGLWSSLKVWWSGNKSSHETKALSLTLLTKVFIINSSTVSHTAFNDIFTMYLDLLLDKTSSTAIKMQALDLLMFFVVLPEPQLSELKKVLDCFIADNFPMKSSEFPVGSSKYSEYTTALDKILLALEFSASPVLLQLVISILCRERQHTYEDNIQKALAKMMKRLREDRQKPCLDIPFMIFIEEGTLTNDQRRSAVEKVVLPLLRVSKMSALTEFFSNHIVQIISAIEAKDVKSPEWAMETQLTTKTGCFFLVEIMYSCLTKDAVHSKDSKINSIYCANKPDRTGKEMTTTLTKITNCMKSEDMRGEMSFLELRRQLHCAAYNALIAIISSTQTDLKFYNGFLFSENPTKGQLLWDNLIDQKKMYEFPLEMEAPMTRRSRFVAIRQENRQWLQQQHLGDDSDKRLSPFASSVHYLSSQYLTESSLNVDVSQFDFTGSVTLLSRSQSLSGSQTTRTKKGSIQGRQSAEGEVLLESLSGFLELEMDSLNQHESMAPLTVVINHINQNIKTDKDEKEMPSWINSLHIKMSSDCHLNIKLFLVKVILNSEKIFRPYARFWMLPLIELITETSLGNGGINYLINDIVVMLLAWHSIYKPGDNPRERAAANHLLQFLMKNCYHDNRQILRNNLEVLKTLVEVWHDSIDVPSKILYDSFNERDSKSKRNATGVQMVGVFVANGLLPYRTGQSVDRDSFYKLLALNMTNEQKMVYSAAAEVCGMTLKLLSDDVNSKPVTGSTSSSLSSSSDQEWFDQYVENLSSMLTRLVDETKKLDNFIICIHRIQLHYPPISDRFMPKVLYVFPKVYGDFKSHCLEIIEKRIDYIPNVFLELKSKGFLDLLSQRDETTQLVSMKVVLALLRHLKENELTSLLPSLVHFISSSNPLCRSVMYDVFIWIYDNYRNGSGDITLQILATAKEILLKGLNDDDEKNRLNLLNFWTHETRLPTCTLNRLVAVLEALYSPETESHYLSYATNLMMELTSKSPDFNREIFDRPLSECKFLDYKIQSSWYQRHAAMTPLFVETQVSTQMVPGSQAAVSGNDRNSLASRQLRVTQDVTSFLPTQASATRGPYNWLTQNSLDVGSDSLMDTSADAETGSSMGQSSLLFTVGKTGVAGAARKKFQPKAVGADFGRERLGQKSKQTDEAGDRRSSDILNLRRRFVKSQEEQSRIFFAKRQTRLTEQREHSLQEQRQRREHQVTMYRSYRIGDLPDIQIKYSFIIAPLQGLAQRDSTIAQLLFSSLFNAMFAEIEKEKTEKESEEMVLKISNSLNNVLRTSVLYFPPVQSFIMDIALANHKQLRLDPALVSQCCISGSIQPLGILLLEEMITQSDSTVREPQAKRFKISSRAIRPQNADIWIELARLYKSVGENDFVRGIFGNHIGTRSFTKEAIEAEMRNDYQVAARIYAQGLCLKDEDVDSQPTDLEMDFWEESRLQCLDRLCQWEKLEKACHHLLDNDPSEDETTLDSIWEDEIFQEKFLPVMIRSKLKLLLSSGHQQTFLNFLDRAMKFPERKTILELNYCEELALLYVWQDNYDRANHYAAMATQLFFQDWSGISDLLSFSRLSKLQSLQKLIELQEFLELMKMDSSSQRMPAAKHLLTVWTKRSPDFLLDPLSIWDDVISSRCVYVDHMAHYLKSEENLKMLSSSSSEAAWDRYKVVFRLQQVDASRIQNSFSLALQLLKSTRKESLERCKIGDIEPYLKWTECYVKTHHQRVKVLTHLEPTEKIKILASAREELDKVGEKAALNSLMLRKQHQLLAETVQLMADILSSEWLNNFTSASDDVKNILASAAGCKASAPDELLVSLVEKGFLNLNQCIASFDDVAKCEKALVSTVTVKSDIEVDINDIQKAHMAMFNYCDKYLLEADEGFDQVVKTCPSFNQFPSVVVKSLLTAMKMNSHEAEQLFPRLLQVIALYPDVINLFIEYTSCIPCWKFLGWISQITAILDKPESISVHQILIDVALHYPQALVYPFKLSSESYNVTDNSKNGQKIRSVIERLKSILSKNRLIDKLICELEQFDQPNIVFKEWMDEFTGLLRRQSPDRKHMLHLYEAMYSKLGGKNSSSASIELYDTRPSVETGPYWKNFQKKFANELDKLCGRDGTNLHKITPKEFFEKASKLNNEMRNACDANLKPPATIKEYSPWLAEFQGNHFNDEIEIPGQYIGFNKPLPEYHTKIEGFQETVLVMTSLRRPKRIIIRGNDAKDYKFLVKCGEDLRQDQRIEILFGLMNDIFSRDATCRKMSLHIRTYQVVPMTTRLGILEWMEQTVPLKQQIKDVLSDKEEEFMNAAAKDHANFIGGNYMTSYKKLSRSEVSTAFRKRENLIQWDLLRRAYWKMSSCPEAFYCLRMKFGQTHSQLCICHYVLGIGDRHQSNFMIDRVSGAMVGIDFGHAFGTATQFLPVPEMVPFRLTRQILNMFLPLRERGLMEGVMVYTLRALRANANILISTMDVFIKEPSLDWKKNAERLKKQMQDNDLTETELDDSWYPKQTINVVKRKLRGDNCAHIMRSELRLGHRNKPYFKDLEVVLMGEPGRNVRADCQEEKLTVEKQVACLIDLATDPNILGRFWIGWEPWI